MRVYGEYFYGNKISDYGLENGFVDYATLAKSFDAVLNNDLMQNTYEIGYWEMVSGFVNHDEEIEEIEETIESLQEKLEDAIEEDTIEELTQKIDILEDKKSDLECEDIPEVYQWYIVSDAGANILQEINEIVYYNETLDIYLWGVTHYGTSWSYVLTDIRCNTGYEEVNENEEI